MKKYFLHDGTAQHGPFDMAELATKIITAQTMVWFEPMPEWKPAGEIDELRSLLNSKVPASQILTPPIVAAKEEDWSKKQYYYTDDHGQQGPFTPEQLKSRPITAHTPVWYDPLPEWTTAGKVAGLKDIINHVQQVITPVAAQKRSYYYMDNAVQQGPFTLEQMKGRPVNAATLIWYDGLAEWIKAGSEESLKDIISHAQQVITPVAPQKRLYYYIDNAVQQGPFTLEQMKGKPVTAATLIWYDTLPEWIKAGSEENLKDIINHAQQVVTPVVPQKRFYYYMDNAGQQGPFTYDQMKGKPVTAATLIWYDGLAEWIKAGSEESLKEIINGGDWSKKLFYYTDGGGQQGPFTLEQLKGKSITPATPVWYDPLPQWTTAGQVDVLKSIIT